MDNDLSMLNIRDSILKLLRTRIKESVSKSGVSEIPGGNMYSVIRTLVGNKGRKLNDDLKAFCGANNDMLATAWMSVIVEADKDDNYDILGIDHADQFKTPNKKNTAESVTSSYPNSAFRLNEANVNNFIKCDYAATSYYGYFDVVIENDYSAEESVAVSTGDHTDSIIKTKYPYATIKHMTVTKICPFTGCPDVEWRVPALLVALAIYGFNGLMIHLGCPSSMAIWTSKPNFITTDFNLTKITDNVTVTYLKDKPNLIKFVAALRDIFSYCKDYISYSAPIANDVISEFFYGVILARMMYGDNCSRMQLIGHAKAFRDRLQSTCAEKLVAYLRDQLLHD